MTDPAYTHIEFLLDRSGSMYSIRPDIEGGFNAFVDEQRTGTGRCTVSLAQFNDRYQVIYSRLDVRQVPPLELRPSGSTALLDAIGRSITALGEHLAATPEQERPGQVVVAIMTDGLENASTEYGRATIKAMIEHQESAYNWAFLYMGADQDAIEVGAGLGIDPGRAMTYDRAHTQDVYRSVSANILTSRDLLAGGAVAGAETLSFTEQDRRAARGQG